MPGRLQYLLCLPCLLCYHCSEDIDDAAKTEAKKLAEANAAWNAQPQDLQGPCVVPPDTTKAKPKHGKLETKSVSITLPNST